MKKYMEFLIIAAYILFAQTAVLLVKLGADDTSLAFKNGNLSVLLNIKTIMGLCLYICSFLLWIVVLSRNNLSIVTPVITGANYIIPMAIGIILLKEKMTVQQWIGAAIILAGLLVSYQGINLKS